MGDNNYIIGNNLVQIDGNIVPWLLHVHVHRCISLLHLATHTMIDIVTITLFQF